MKIRFWSLHIITGKHLFLTDMPQFEGIDSGSDITLSSNNGGKIIGRIVVLSLDIAITSKC